MLLIRFMVDVLLGLGVRLADLDTNRLLARHAGGAPGTPPKVLAARAGFAVIDVPVATTGPDDTMKTITD
jgi:hypothetical protein